MSLFGVGGTVGFAIGPLLITGALLQWELKGTLILFIPVTIMAIIMTTQFSAFDSLEKSREMDRSASRTGSEKEEWWAFSRLTVTIIGRSIIFYGLNTFIPIYWINGLHQSKTAGAMALTIFAGSGIVGNLLGGGLADKIGRKKVILIGMIGLTLFLPILILSKNVLIATLLLIPIGLMLYGTYSPSIVLGQQYLPNRVGLSSGVTLGVAVAIGGAAAPVIGKIADIHGIWYAMVSIACLPVFTSAMALSLPDSQKTIASQKMKEFFNGAK
jgi:FSR family fosmidomycin resistance protein-like MFS transporter